MKILVYGVGGVGGYLGAFLLKTRYEISFISRGKNFLQLKEKGINLRSNIEAISHKKIKIFREVPDLHNFDIIIISVKLYDLEEVIDCIKKKIHKNCLILPFQNGIYAEEILKEKLDLKFNFGAVAQISSYINQNSEIIHNGKLATFFVGPISKDNDLDKLRYFTSECRNIGLDLRYTEKIKEKIWDKFIFLSAYSGMTTLTGLSIGEIFENTTHKNMFISAMHEAFNLSSFFKIEFNYDPIEKWLEKIEKMPYDLTSSMYLDFKKGKKLELNWLSGLICSYAKKFKINSNIHQKIVDGIKLNNPSLV